MGIDIHALNFLRYAVTKKRFDRVATIGRQSLVIAPATLSALMRLPKSTRFGSFCEDLLLQHFGASAVDSYDYSDYEGATHIVDMNKPLRSDKQYDTIIDCGCVEHIYNVPQALANISTLCNVGGQVLHVLPAINFCGHGFWQFSPELFFSLYCEANGYRDTEVFLADLANEEEWFEVERPTQGQRAEVISSSPVYVLCRTLKTGPFSHDAVQQSDYVQRWEDQQAPKKHNKTILLLKKAIKRSPFLYRVSSSACTRIRSARKALTPIRLSSANRHLRKRYISELLGS